MLKASRGRGWSAGAGKESEWKKGKEGGREREAWTVDGRRAA